MDLVKLTIKLKPISSMYDIQERKGCVIIENNGRFCIHTDRVEEVYQRGEWLVIHCGTTALACNMTKPMFQGSMCEAKHW